MHTYLCTELLCEKSVMALQCIRLQYFLFVLICQSAEWRTLATDGQLSSAAAPTALEAVRTLRFPRAGDRTIPQSL